MRIPAGLSRAVAAACLCLGSTAAFGAPVIFSGGDPGVGPGGARPNSNIAATVFTAAAGALGTISLIDFEAVPLGNFATLTIAPGVDATLSGTAADTNAGIANDTGSASLGYNTTAGGSRYLRVVPIFDVGTASLQIDFTTSIQAFGAFITGLGTANGNLHVLFDDGTAQDIGVSGNASGGVQFFGFTSDAASFDRVTLSLQGVQGGSRDIIGFDDLIVANAVPEPASLALLGIAALGLACARRRSRA